MKSLFVGFNNLGKDKKIEIGIIAWVALSWIWIFSSKVSELASSTLVGYLVALFAFSVIVGLTCTAYILAFRRISKWIEQEKKVDYLLALKLFVVIAATEFVIIFVTSFVWMGRDGSVDTMLPFVSFAPFLAHTPMVFVSRFLGFHGLSALFILLLTVSLSTKLRAIRKGVYIFSVFLAVAGWLAYSKPGTADIKVVAVAEHLDEKVATLITDADLAVFPEYGFDEVVPPQDRLAPAGEDDVFYVGSELVRSDESTHNDLIFGSLENGTIEVRSKSRLIPGGEYLPFFAEGFLRTIRADKTLEYFDETKAIDKGEISYQPFSVGDIRLGAAVCASIISTEDYRKFAQNGANLFTNSASLGIFDSPLFTLQHEGLAKFMAVANARSFVQSSNSGNAFVVSQNGRMQAKTSPLGQVEEKVGLNSHKTVYTIIGEWPVFLGLLFFAARTVKALYRRHVRKVNS